MNKEKTIAEIQSFLEGRNEDLKYLVNVEVDQKTNRATCIIHEPNQEKRMEMVKYTPFLYTKNFKKEGYRLYNGDTRLLKDKMKGLGIEFHMLDTKKQPRLENGYSVKVTSSVSYANILKFFRDGGIDPYEKIRDEGGNIIKDGSGRASYKYRKLFYQPRNEEQFLISTGSRLYKGINEYNEVHKLIFDIETTGLRHKIARIFAIGLKDNRGFEHILEVDKPNDDESEKRLIQDFFNLVALVRPAIIAGYNSEFFDFDFILGRAEVMKMSLDNIPTTLDDDAKIKKYNSTVKFGNTSERYRATGMWGYSVIDIIHAAKKTQSVNSEIKNTKLKYICKFEKVAKPNRTYIDGEDGKIGKFWHDNNSFIVNPEDNTYLEIPQEFQEVGNKFLLLQKNKEKLKDGEHKHYRKIFLDSSPDFVKWLRENGKDYGKFQFIGGKELLHQYLLDDLWETEKVDDLYNQSSFLLAKIVPTTYTRINTMGTAGIWNLLLTAWSFDNNLAIPVPDKKSHFTGGLSRCFRVGFVEKLVKIDFASLYPMIQMEDDVFPNFDTTGVIKKMLMYMTTTRNIYKKLANGDSLNDEEMVLLLSTGHDDVYKQIKEGKEFTKAERNAFKVKQLPIKILNNSLFGALGSGFAFNWSDNICAERITCTGRLHLRHVIDWFRDYDCEPLLAVTDGVNFAIPNTTNIGFDNAVEVPVGVDTPIDDAWKYGDLVGIAALIEKYNNEETYSEYMSVDNDGEFISCYNLARINYSLYSETTDKVTGEKGTKVKNIGNTIKSKTMPEYIEDFIDNGMELILKGKGKEFFEYYVSYAEDLFLEQIPLKKIASKKKVKVSIEDYMNRGNDKTGKKKAKQAHMELIIQDRNDLAMEIFQKNPAKFVDINKKPIEKYTIKEIHKLVVDYMPPLPELDSMIYYVNTGTRKSHGDVKSIKNKETGEVSQILQSTLIRQHDLEQNPDLKGHYNVDKYLDAFNTRVEKLINGYAPEIRDEFFVKIVRTSEKDSEGKKVEKKDFIRQHFTADQLKLSSYPLDTIEDAMYIEDSETDFWNRSGYDPNKVWDKFKVHKENPLEPEIYEFKLNYLSEEMAKKGKPRIHSINDTISKNDYILFKNQNDYNLGYHNGEYIEVIRRDLELPKSPTELAWDEERIAKEKKIEALKLTDNVVNEAEILEKQREVELFGRFKAKWGLDESMTMDTLFKAEPKARDAFDDFIYETEDVSDIYDETEMLGVD